MMFLSLTSYMAPRLSGLQSSLSLSQNVEERIKTTEMATNIPNRAAVCWGSRNRPQSRVNKSVVILYVAISTLVLMRYQDIPNATLGKTSQGEKGRRKQWKKTPYFVDGNIRSSTTRATPPLRSRSSLICVRVLQNLEPRAIQANINISDQPQMSAESPRPAEGFSSAFTKCTSTNRPMSQSKLQRTLQFVGT